MPNDPLSLPPDVLDESPGEAAYQAVHAVLMATEQGRNFVTEYARRNLDPDTRKFVSTVERLKSAVRGQHVPQISATMFQYLKELARTIERSEAIFLAAGDSAANELLAVERIQDICMALRRRDVEPALCDALEASAREIGDAMVRNNAAAGASSIPSLLRDLSVRVNDVVALYNSVISLDAEDRVGENAPREEATIDECVSANDAKALLSIAAEKTADDETGGDSGAERLDHTADESPADADGAVAFCTDRAGSQLDELALPLPAPEGEAQASPEQESGAELEPPFDAVAHITNKPENDAGAEMVVPTDTLRPAEPATQRAPQSESLRAILALSEEELMALFT